MTELERIQKQIDRCNNCNGCYTYCSVDRQRVCRLLKARAERIDYCKEHGIPIERW